MPHMITPQEKATAIMASPRAFDLIVGEIQDRRSFLAENVELEHKLLKAQMMLDILQAKYKYVCEENSKLRDELLELKVRSSLEIRRPSFESEEEAEVPPTTPEVPNVQPVEEQKVEEVQEQIAPVVQEPSQPKRKYTRKEAFDFVERTDKTLSKTTLANYKAYLNKIYALSCVKHEEDSTKKVIANKEDLLNNTDYVNSLIKEISNDRLKICGIYSAIFYVLGKQDFTQDNRAEQYTTQFRKHYYTEAYQKQLAEQGKIVSNS